MNERLAELLDRAARCLAEGMLAKASGLNESRIAELYESAATCIAQARAELGGRSPDLAADLAEFIAAECFQIDGAKVKFGDFFIEFAAFARKRGRRYNKCAIGKSPHSLPDATPYGKGHSNQRHIGNCWLRSSGTPPTPGPRLVRVGDKLKPRWVSP